MSTITKHHPAVEVYKFDILRADRACDLHELHSAVTADDWLDSVEKSELCELIREKFCRLNARPAAKPRWS